MREKESLFSPSNNEKNIYYHQNGIKIILFFSSLSLLSLLFLYSFLHRSFSFFSPSLPFLRFVVRAGKKYIFIIYYNKKEINEQEMWNKCERNTWKKYMKREREKKMTMRKKGSLDDSKWKWKREKMTQKRRKCFRFQILFFFPFLVFWEKRKKGQRRRRIERERKNRGKRTIARGRKQERNWCKNNHFDHERGEGGNETKI